MTQTYIATQEFFLNRDWVAVGTELELTKSAVKYLDGQVILKPEPVAAPVEPVVEVVEVVEAPKAKSSRKADAVDGGV
jgi:hypothetical protein